MFTAEKANLFMNKAKNNQLNSWFKLQQEIRERAIRGYDYLYLTSVNYLNLTTSLEVNGYKVAYDKDAGLWYCSWA